MAIPWHGSQAAQGIEAESPQESAEGAFRGLEAESPVFLPATRAGKCALHVREAPELLMVYPQSYR
ncbi:MAG: hypothetical protein LBK13_06960 [Spirochaetales bacterium]|nr:hypothetical protein [Spirochaetales bacterium]